MDGAWLARARWRQRGAWLWPTFVMLAIADGVIVHALPMAGETQTLVGGVVFGLVLNVIAVLLLSRPLARLLRRRRTDMPVGVARNYGGTFAVVLVSAGMLAIGLLHHPAIVADRHALNDAIVRAEAYIGDRAPPEFRVNVMHTDTYTIQPRTVYRTCVPNRAGTRTYCVIVKPTSIAFGGYEPNSVLAEGTN
jgi:Kef-type K+ transport system membrane component KefB